MNCDTKTPYAGDDGILPQKKGNLLLENKNHLSYHISTVSNVSLEMPGKQQKILSIDLVAVK